MTQVGPAEAFAKLSEAFRQPLLAALAPAA